VAFTVTPTDVQELAEGDPHEVALENARRKARAVPGDLVLGVDTLVALDGAIYGKPRDEDHAKQTLRALAGRTHLVISGIALEPEGRSAIAVTEVTFRALDDAWLDWYVDLGEWHGRAGGYAIQGRGAALVRGIRGDYLNVVGLPVPDLLDLLPQAVMQEKPVR
jgi:septum formation protein